MAITDAQKAKLNGMCVSAKGALLGTAFQQAQTDIATLQGVKTGTYTVIQADQDAGTKSIPAGKTVTSFIVTILRAGKVTTSGAAISGSTTNLVVATNGATYVLTKDDVINFIVW